MLILDSDPMQWRIRDFSKGEGEGEGAFKLFSRVPLFGDQEIDCRSMFSCGILSRLLSFFPSENSDERNRTSDRPSSNNATNPKRTFFGERVCCDWHL